MPVSSSGTFRVASVNGVFSKSGNWSGGGVGHVLRTDADIIFGINHADTTDQKVAFCGRLTVADAPAHGFGPARIGFGFDSGGSVVALDGGAAGPIAALPPGLLVATAKLRVKGDKLSSAPANVDIYFQQNKIAGTPEGLVDYSAIAATGFKEFDFTISIPTMFHLVDDGFGIRYVGDTENDGCYFYAAEITGTYVVVQWWWTIPAVDDCNVPQDQQYQLAPESPGDEWEQLDPDDYDAHPTPVIATVTPNHGQAGAAVTITGSGFGLGATVEFDGIAATSVVVPNSSTITCVAPAHAAGEVTVVVTNADGVTS